LEFGISLALGGWCLVLFLTGIHSSGDEFFAIIVAKL
jgi:hypothetical protein